MKKFLYPTKQYLAILLVLFLTFQGSLLHFENFGKPEHHLDKYPLFFGSITMIALYAIPLILFIRYLSKCFKVDSLVISLSWLGGLFAAISLSTNFHIAIGFLLRNIFHPSEAFIGFWGAAIAGPLAEEFGKGLIAFLVLLICRQFDLKTALVSGMIVGLGFQIIEDCVFTFQEIFMANKSPFPTLIERIVWAGCTHWVFSSLFVLGMILLWKKNCGFSNKLGVFWICSALIIHGLFNIPIDSNIYEVATATLNTSLFLVALKFVSTKEVLRH